MSCCSCGNNCSPGCGCLYMVIPGDPSGSYSLMNVNTLGVGVADGQDGTQFNFRGVASSSGALIVTYDAGSHAIMLTVDIPGIVDEIPTATTTVRGIGETATDAEALGKVAVDKFLTPSNLAALGSSTTFAGLIEIATNAEAAAGVSTSLAITPASLAFVLTTIGDTKTWADAAARAVLVPDFAGQFGVQLDTDIAYISSGTAAGDFNQPLFTLDNGLNQVTVDTTIDIFGAGITLFFTGTGGGNYVTTAPWVFQGGSTLEFNGGILNFALPGSPFLQIGGVAVPANRVMITSGVAGDLTSVATIGTFVSTFDVQIGYTAFANGAVLRTCDTTTVTLPQLAQIVGTLIEDLKAVQLPAT